MLNKRHVVVAAKIGEQIDRAVDIRENNSGGYEPQPFRAQAMLAKVASESSAVQPAGIINIRSNVTATFSLK